MKKVSEALKELGIEFTFPIDIRNSNGKQTYYEDIYGYYEKWEYDANGKETYYENSYGRKRGTPRKLTKMKCECGGKLIFDHQNDGQYMGGYVYSYKCDKCQMLHFFQTKPK